jgi:hypothetical protein
MVGGGLGDGGGRGVQQIISLSAGLQLSGASLDDTQWQGRYALFLCSM